MALGEASVRIVPDTKGFAEQLEADIRAALKGVEDQVEDTTEDIEDKFKESSEESEKAVKGIGEEFKKLGKLIAGAAISRAVFSFAKTSIAAASDLGESINAVQVTFGELSDEILAFSEISAKAVGLSSADFNSFAVRFAGFTKQIATGSKNAAAVTEELTTRIADFASVMNLDLNEAATVFASTLAGESEAIRRFGIDMSAASIEAFALANGMIQSKDEMTAAIKVQATYAKLMADTAQVQGDFANTSDSLANRQRILAAEMKNLQVEVGSALVPVMESLLSIVGPVLDVFNELPTGLQQAITYAALAGGAFLGLSSALQGVGVSAKKANALLGKIGLGLTAFAAVVSVFSKTMNVEADEAFDGLTDAIKESDKAIRNAALLKVAEESPKIRQYLDLWGQFGIKIDDLNQYFMSGDGPALEYVDALQKMSLASGDVEDKIKRINDGFGTNFDVTKLSRQEMELIVDAAGDLQYQMFELDQANLNTIQSTDALNSALGESTEALNREKMALDDVNSAIGRLKNSLDLRLTMLEAQEEIEGFRTKWEEAMKNGEFNANEFEKDLIGIQLMLLQTREDLGITATSFLNNEFRVLVDTKQLERAWLLLQAIASGGEVKIPTGPGSGDAALMSRITPRAVGGVITSPEIALIGEAGAEAVIPLTQPARALELMRESGLIGLAQQSGAGQNFDIKVVSAEPMRTAKDVVREFQALEYRMGPL